LKTGSSTSGKSEEPSITGSASPPSGAVLEHLNAVLTSDVFSGAARQRRLLQHLVERHIEGRTSELKEYSLGVEVFDRGEEFDPRLDPIVRVEASRLRSRLQKYYETSGAGAQLRIELPRGAYVPAFVAKSSANAAAPSSSLPPVQLDTISAPPVEASTAAATSPVTPAPEPATRPQSAIRKIWLAPALGALIVAGGVAVWKASRPAPEPPPPSFASFTRVTQDLTRSSWPTLSPDGQSLVYTGKDDGNWKLFLKKIGSLDATDLTPDSAADNLQPAFSPDGKQIAFRSSREGGGIFLLDVGSQKLRRLTTSGYNPSWSPDGRKIVFSSESFSDPLELSTERQGVLRVVDLQSGKISALTSQETAYDALQPAWSPHGSRIAFWGIDTNGDRDLWTVEAGGTPGQTTRVTHDMWTDWSPTWSPDGRHLYFSSDRGGSMNLWRVRVDESSGAALGEPEPVTTPSSFSGWLAFSKDGAHFAYVRRLVSSKLYRARFDRAKGAAADSMTALTAGTRRVREPNMSPDGKWLVVRVQDPQEDLALVRPDGGGMKRLTNDEFSDRLPRWSPDGKAIAFMSNRDGKFNLWSIQPDGRGLRQLTKNGMFPWAWTPDGSLTAFPLNAMPVVLDPAGKAAQDWGLPPLFRPISWSPDHRRILGRMRSSSAQNAGLYVYTPEANDFWEISPDAPHPATVWTNDSQALLFSSDAGIFLADLVKRETRPVLTRLGGVLHSRFSLSRDEKTLYFVMADDEEDIWMSGS
jgi:Tol biopolymer transport system component